MWLVTCWVKSYIKHFGMYENQIASETDGTSKEEL